jgi:hypothetical protein
MKTFKSISDVEQVLGTPVHDTVRELVVPVIESFSDSAPYRPEDDGYLVLIERDDVDRILEDLDMPYRLSEVPYEAVDMIDGHFHAFYIPNNQFCIDFLIPDEAWLPDVLRKHLEDNLDT